MMAAQTRAIRGPYSAMVKAHRQRVDGGSHPLQHQAAPAHRAGVVLFLIADAVQQHLAADVAQQDQGDPGDQDGKALEQLHHRVDADPSQQGASGPGSHSRALRRLRLMPGSWRPLAIETEKASIANPTPSRALLIKKTRFHSIVRFPPSQKERCAKKTGHSGGCARKSAEQRCGGSMHTARAASPAPGAGNMSLAMGISKPGPAGQYVDLLRRGLQAALATPLMGFFGSCSHRIPYEPPVCP